jgi:hypothetical protein
MMNEQSSLSKDGYKVSMSNETLPVFIKEEQEALQMEALKFGPIKLQDAVTGHVEYKIPREWVGRCSKVPFGINVSPDGPTMEIVIPGKHPTPLSLPMGDEESVFNYARTVDLALALATDKSSVSGELVLEEASSLSWLCGLMKNSADAADRQIETMIEQAPPQNLAMMDTKRMYGAAATLRKVADRLDEALVMHIDRRSLDMMESQRQGDWAN